jgi:hypothetical protein
VRGNPPNDEVEADNEEVTAEEEEEEEDAEGEEELYDVNSSEIREWEDGFNMLLHRVEPSTPTMIGNNEDDDTFANMKWENGIFKKYREVTMSAITLTRRRSNRPGSKNQ